jgi:alpha-N-arabinofuranosidase
VRTRARSRRSPADSTIGRTFTNPILPGFQPDPSICRVGDDFYLVTSSFEYFPGIPIFHSRDLVHWRQLGHVLTERRQLELAGVPSSDGIYAPTIRHDGARFAVITTHVGGGGNFYVTAEDPSGPWSDPVWLDQEGFDPSLLFADGTAYYTRDGKGPDPDHPLIYQGTLDMAAGKIVEEPRPIWSGTGGVWPEGAHIYLINGRYYLFAAEGGTSYEHSEVVARGPSPFGPFEPGPSNPILTHRERPEHPIQATGHADVVQLADGTSWMVFLGIRPMQGSRTHQLGRETFLAPLTWTEDGWPVVAPVELRMAAPALPPHPFTEAPAREDFDAPRLAPEWCFVRNPDPQDLSLEARPGWLRLMGSAVSLDDVASPALIVRRQQHFRVRCRAALDFAPHESNEEAGLTVRANERFRYDLGVRLSGAGREAVLSTRLAGVARVVRRVPIGEGPVELRVTATEKTYRFGVEAAGKPWALGTLPAQALSAEEIARQGGKYFTGTCIGLYATGNGRRSTAPADFDWFEYAP